MTEPDLFDGFEMDEIAAYVFATEGPDAFRQLLDVLVDDHEWFNRGTLIHIADKLDAAGLGEAVAIVVETIEALDDEAPAVIPR
jgi:hypothetical protein